MTGSLIARSSPANRTISRMQVPLSTYRVQFNSNFRFADAEKLVPYLHDLGITHLYASPILQARGGSEHGYDVADPTHLSADLGTETDFERLSSQLKRHSMGLLLDIVPNHMTSSVENPWWRDVLEFGENSSYASYFDIDWQASGSKFPVVQRGRIVLPVLSDFYDSLLKQQKLALRISSEGFQIEAEGNRFPVNPETWPMILEPLIDSLQLLPSAHPDDTSRIQRILASVQSTSAQANRQRSRSELWQLYESNPAFRSTLDQTLAGFNGDKSDPNSFERLHQLISAQHYRLAYWRNASEEINYRRFFGLNELVALRIELPETFRAVHRLIFEMVSKGQIDALRVDHVDGLRDPAAYLAELQKVDVPQGEDDSGALKIYTIVEKITSGRESIPAEWATAGTTGYDYLNAVNTLFVDAAGSRILEEGYREFTGIRSSFGETWNVRKKQVMDAMFASDVRRLDWRLAHLAALDRLGADIPMRELVRGLKEITAGLAIYRTYFRDLQLESRDRHHLEKAFQNARERTPESAVSSAAFKFLQSVFLLRPTVDLHQHKAQWLDFLESWQQFTGAVMGKGLEDTAFFVHHGLISLNEVGTNPLRKEIAFGVNAFHRYNQRVSTEHPFTMNATSTHDTKWSEDVRARINVLSEMPAEWKARLGRWTQWNQNKRSTVDDRVAPSPNEEILLYQSMLGIWPPEGVPAEAQRGELCNRLQQFILKAAREAKTHSSWVSPNEAHENALKRFVCSVLDAKSENLFLIDFSEFVERIAPTGACNAFAQVLLKITSPGIPDLFQGNELWNLRLTDPDNRNAVDFNQRAELLSGLPLNPVSDDPAGDNPAGDASVLPAALLHNWKDGRLKLYLTRAALNFRRRHRNLFLHGEYLPLDVAGAQRNHICAFARRFQDQLAVIVASRLTFHLSRDDSFPMGQTTWGTTTITLPASAPPEFRNIFTGDPVVASRAGRKKTLGAASVFSTLPFALLFSV
jgi:(1->4)-alpha-D-glucan 1-alpha-D-glucosylmutase